MGKDDKEDKPKEDKLEKRDDARLDRQLSDPTQKRFEIETYRAPDDNSVGATKVAEEIARRMGVSIDPSGTKFEDGHTIMRVRSIDGSTVSSIVLPPFVHTMARDAASDYIRDAIRRAAGAGAQDPAMKGGK